MFVFTSTFIVSSGDSDTLVKHLLLYILSYKPPKFFAFGSQIDLVSVGRVLATGAHRRPVLSAPVRFDTSRHSRLVYGRKLPNHFLRFKELTLKNILKVQLFL